MEKIVTVILARAGSRRIPRKNVMPYRGRPLIEWTLIDAWKLSIPIWVFTDMPEVRKIADQYHANVREKLFERDDGFHQTGLELAEYNKEMDADVIIYLQATSPERDLAMVRAWIAEFLQSDYDCGFSAVPMREGMYYDATGREVNFSMDRRDYNSNVKSELYRENGSFYIFRRGQIGKNHFLNGRRMVFADRHELDIDTIGDAR